MGFSITFDKTVDQFKNEVYQSLSQATERLLFRITSAVAFATPVDTGYLRGSWYWGAPPQSNAPGARPNRRSINRARRSYGQAFAIAPGSAGHYSYRPAISFLNGRQFGQQRGIFYVDNRVYYGHYVNSVGGRRNQNFGFTQRALRGLGYTVVGA